MKHHIIPSITLALFSMFFTELLSGNAPFLFFFQPITFVFLIITYSFPVLLIRELLIRYNLGLPALSLLGIAYGVYNEGILAKTFLLAQNVPIPAFDHYGFFLGINWTWLVNMTSVHIVISVIFPIFIISLLFPKNSQQSWLNKTSISILFALFVGLGILVNLNNKPIGMLYAGIFTVTIIALIIGALLLGSRGKITSISFIKPKKAVSLGILFWLAFSLGSVLLAGFKVPLWMYFAYEFGIIAIVGWFMRLENHRTEQTLAFMGLGFYLSMAVFGMIAGLLNLELITVGVSLIFIIILLLLIHLLQKKNNVESLQTI